MKHFKRLSLIALCVVLIFLFQNATMLTQTSGEASISADVFGSPLVITTTSRLAGAIGSLTWNGQEFINQEDHGRELQSASSYDGLGECLNPTEAGSDADGQMFTSTSRPLNVSTANNILTTTIQMAYWLQTKTPYPLSSGCGFYPNIKIAQNPSNLSPDSVTKTVKIGLPNLPNVIEYNVTFHVVGTHKSATFEALTGYMPRSFSSFYTFNPLTSELASISAWPHVSQAEQTLPLIFATSDERYAMGIFSTELPQPNFMNMGYGRFDFSSQNVVKWNAVYRNAYTPPGDYSFKQYVIVGTLEQVSSSMKTLNEILPKDIIGKIEGISTVNGQRFVDGWACTRTLDDSIPVHMYLNGPMGQGRFIGSYIANRASEADVARACQSGGKQFRFSIPLNGTLLSQNAGDTIYIHGISPVQRENKLLNQSGKFLIPGLIVKATTPVYRFYHTSLYDHFYTNNRTEGINAGYRDEGIGFKLATSSMKKTTALYRCLWGRKHLVSIQSSCEGTKMEGVLGYIFTEQIEGSIPLYRFFNYITGDHFMTTNFDEALNKQYQLEAIIGYVLP